MKKFSFSALILCLLCTVFVFAGCNAFGRGGIPDTNVDMTPRQIILSQEEEMDAAMVVSEIKPAIVGIETTTAKYRSVGSGVAVALGGYILTNHHVVDGAKQITVYFADKTNAPATLLWSDSTMDMAIIQTTADIPYLTFSNYDTLAAGQEVFAVGTPLSLQFKHTVTKGIISALERTMEIENENGSFSYLQNLIQHDASINPGNSGGPLVNMNGQVVGINTLKVTNAEGLGFAIPIEPAQVVLAKIVSNKKYQTPYLGIYGFDADIAKFHSRTMEEDGVYLLTVDSKGPAGMGGLAVGDVIVGIGNENIKTMLDLRTAIYRFSAGDEVVFTFKRGNSMKTALVVFSDRT